MSRSTVPSPLAVVALGGVLALGACGTVTTGDEDTASSTGRAEVTSCGRTVTVDAPPERIVSMHPSLTDLLVRLGVEDRVVAQAQDGLGDASDDVADAVDAIPSLSSDVPPTREVLLAETPDLVLSGTEYEFSADQGFAGYDDLEQAGAAAYVATAGCVERRSEGTVEDLLTDVEDLGRLLGVEDRADELAAQVRADLDAVAETVGDADPVRAAQVYVEGGKLYGIGGAVEVDVLRLGGGENLFGRDDDRFADFFAAEVNPEVVLDLAPEALVFAVNDAEHEAETLAYLRENLASTPAVRDDRLVAVPNSAVQPGSVAAVDGARLVAEALHG